MTARASTRNLSPQVGSEQLERFAFGLPICIIPPSSPGTGEHSRFMSTNAIARMAGAALALTLFGLSSGCGSKEEGPAPTPPTIEFVTVQQKDVPIYRIWVGTLEGNVN